MSPPLRWPLAVLCGFAITPMAPAAVELKQDADKITVNIDGHLFTEYHFANTRRPFLYPIIGPTGVGITRHWPLQDDIPAEEHDHPHHKGLWYGHRNVNGADFWGETEGAKAGTKFGQMLQDAVLEAKGGDDQGVLKTRNKWVLDEGNQLLATDVRTLTFHKGVDGPLLDFDITITAIDQEVVFGDDKDGAMAIRLAESMRVEKPKPKGQKTAIPGDGHILTSDGKTDGAAWGARGDWCDYYGPLDGRTVGVAIFDHPSNPRHPTWWHVRTYGLFAANPFGQAQFEKLPDKNAGAFKVAPGQSVTFRYRFYFHEGDTTQAKVADHYKQYAGPKTASAGN